MLEYFVHLDADDPPPDLVLAVAEVPDGLKRASVGATKLPPFWRDTPSPAELALCGDEFVKLGQHALMLIPSVLAPTENNCLINPAHPDFRKISILETQPLNYDLRLFHREHRERKRK